MTNTLESWEQLIEEMKDRSSSQIDILLKPKDESGRHIGGKFSLDEQAITLYTDELARQCQLFFQDKLDVIQYAKVVLAHELGHSLDKQLKGLSHSLESIEDPFNKTRIALLIELNAWKIAKSLLPDVPYTVFSKIRCVSLEHYYDDMDHLYGQAV
jgi:hypothetical protein